MVEQSSEAQHDFALLALGFVTTISKGAKLKDLPVLVEVGFGQAMLQAIFLLLDPEFVLQKHNFRLQVQDILTI
jgi:hypothetical protein